MPGVGTDKLNRVIEGAAMNKFGPKAQQEVQKAMHEFKQGKLKMGRSGKTVTDRDQAIAIGLDKARRAGGKAPKK